MENETPTPTPNPVLDQLLRLRPLVEKLRRALGAIDTTAPPLLPATSIEAVQKAAEVVRVAKQNVLDARKAVRECTDRCHELVNEEAADEVLIDAHRAKGDAAIRLEIAEGRLQVALNRQRGAVASARGDVEKLHAEQRQVALAIANELQATFVRDTPQDTLARTLRALVGQVESLWHTFSPRTHGIEWLDAANAELKALMEADLPEPSQPAQPPRLAIYNIAGPQGRLMG